MSQRDAGLQHERTLLAWERTTLSILVAAFAFGRLWLAWSPVAAVVSAGVAGATAVAAGRSRRASAVGTATAEVALPVVMLGLTELVLLVVRG